MAKPLTSQLTFAGLAPPWQLTQLDGNFTTLWNAVNDVGTYSNTLQDTGAVNSLVANVPAGITFSLAVGVKVTVIVGNTTTAVNPTLNVNSTGAKTIGDLNSNNINRGALQAGGIYDFVYDGTNWRALQLTVGSVVSAYKAANTSRTNTTTLVNDNELAVILVTGVYEFEVLFYPVGTATNTQGIAWNVNYSGTFNANSAGTLISGNPSAIAGTGFVANSPATLIYAIGTNMGTTSYGLMIMVKGSLLATSNGTFAMAWAQSNSSANATNVLLGSYLKCTRIA